MGGLRPYTAHLFGIELTISALAFQQQDLGVSACATTAIWSSLHKYRDQERAPVATPAQITAMACRFTLPTSGRVMPSEAGLSVEQMCQAIQGFGVTPNVLRPKTTQDALSSCHMALKSGFAPVLVIRCPDERHHAVTVVGEVLSRPCKYDDGPYNASAGSSRIGSLFIHDDRFGPYLEAEVHDLADAGNFESDGTAADTRLGLLIPTGNDAVELHIVEHVLTPMPPKIRLSSFGVRFIVVDVLTIVHSSLWAVGDSYLSSARGLDLTILSAGAQNRPVMGASKPAILRRG